MKNNNYNIQDTKYDGNCFFIAVKYALETINEIVSVKELREILSQDISFAQYEEYKYLYNTLKSNYNNLLEEVKSVKNNNKYLETQLRETKDRSKQKDIISSAKIIGKRYEELLEELESAEDILKDYNHMANINNLEQYKEYVKRITNPVFWADSWAISTLEPLIDKKFILLSEAIYNEGDISNVLQCGELHPKLETEGIFKPTHYIILDYNGSHYKLITYKGRGALTFKELPIDIKNMIKDKCLEKNSGVYSLIPEFQSYLKESIQSIEQYDPVENDVVRNQDLNYDNDIVFQVSSRSASKPFPGEGNGESISIKNKGEYLGLSQIADWRKEIARFWDIVYKKKLPYDKNLEILRSKIKNNDKLQKILKLTKRAKLQYFKQLGPALLLKEIMQIREELI